MGRRSAAAAACSISPLQLSGWHSNLPAPLPLPLLIRCILNRSSFLPFLTRIAGHCTALPSSSHKSQASKHQQTTSQPAYVQMSIVEPTPQMLAKAQTIHVPSNSPSPLCLCTFINHAGTHQTPEASLPTPLHRPPDGDCVPVLQPPEHAHRNRLHGQHSQGGCGNLC